MTKLKILALALLLAVGATTTLKAQHGGNGTSCAEVTGQWNTSVSLPYKTAWLFSTSLGQNPTSFWKQDLYLNGSYYGTTYGTSFYVPVWIHGTWSVFVYANVGNCGKWTLTVKL